MIYGELGDQWRGMDILINLMKGESLELWGWNVDCDGLLRKQHMKNFKNVDKCDFEKIEFKAREIK